jgi:hypothetical protein
MTNVINADNQMAEAVAKRDEELAKQAKKKADQPKVEPAKVATPSPQAT